MTALAGASAALATRHGKQTLIEPALASIGLGLVVADVDTDRWGTFAGDVERPAPALDVVVAKARAAASTTGRSMGLASEGTFRPHPYAPGLTVDIELVAFVDTGEPLTVVGRCVRVLSGLTANETAGDDEVRAFCERVGFPTQALVVRAPGRHPPVAKGVVDGGQLRRSVARARELAGSSVVHLEPDLRAHLCPSRQVVIRGAAEDLAARLSRACDACGRPGIGAVSLVPGRPCGLCGRPTRLASAEVAECPGCRRRTTRQFDGAADPSMCDWCNP